MAFLMSTPPVARERRAQSLGKWVSGMSSDANADSLAASRSRRGPSKRTGVRAAALEKLKAAKKKEWNYEVEEEMTDNVYDMVDEKRYAERVQERLEEDFIVDDDGEYADDGREIFDDENEDADGNKGSRKGPRAKKAQRAKEESKKRGNIKNMLLNMPASGRKAGGQSGHGDKTTSIADDDVLGSVLGDLKSKRTTGIKRKATTAMSSPKAAVRSRPDNNPFAKPKPTGIKKRVTKKEEEENNDDHASSSTFMKSLADEDRATETTASQLIEEDMPEPEATAAADQEDLGALIDNDDDFIEEVASQQQQQQQPDEAEASSNRGFIEKKEPGPKKLGGAESCSSASVSFCQGSIVDVAVADDELPLIDDESGEKVLRMYWLDAYEDPFKHAGTVWLFGKVYIAKAKSYVSCCVTVKGIQRRVFLLKRDYHNDDEVQFADVYDEFANKVAKRYKIHEHKSKRSEMSYAFDQLDVPDQAEYLEVVYSTDYPALPSDLQGETFSRVFGANQSSLERFLIANKIKGPCWLDIRQARSPSARMSWCKVEAFAGEPSHVVVVQKDAAPPPPPLSILALNMRTTINPKTKLNEIALFSALLHDELYLDRPAPKQDVYRHSFCALTRPADEAWPFDIGRFLSKESDHLKVDKFDSERALLSFVLAKISKIDPDLIVGHDITGFDIDVLLHRIVTNKIPQWSRLGRLRRAQPPTMRGRTAEKQAVTGRLVCDLKISAKELIRCKSYELGALIEKLLKKPARESPSEGACYEMRRAYDTSKALFDLAVQSMTDTKDILRCVYELNALPLALQITQVAGNVLSRTLLGGRAERNEFLLLHAFNQRGYIVPDKQYGKKHKTQAQESETGDDKAGQASGRRKPAYTGGLVLEPKKGFYDKFILLMDFNSLYPSIIQEYNICFTTVSRKRPVDEHGKPDPDYLPDLPNSDLEYGVLPTEIKKLVESRKVVKKMLKEPGLSAEKKMQYDIRQKALKLTANSMYGCLGFSHSRFFAKPLAALITSRGREILMQTKTLVERMNLEVIYGDTDSIMINSNSTDFDEVFKLGNQIKGEVNKLFKLLELDIDGVYRYMLLLKKKKYAAVTMERTPTGTLVSAPELKGLDIVRRDWSQLAANAGKTILDKVLSDCSAHDRVSFIHSHLEHLAELLRSGQASLDDLKITKQLTKAPEDYADKKSLPHVQVALRLNSKGGKRLKSGDTVEYVICEDGTNLPATQRAYHADEVAERKELKIDVNYYLAQQLHPVVSRLCDPLEGTDTARIASCLGLDPESYRRPQEEEERDLGEEDKFRQCEKLKLKCVCGEAITNDNIVSGLKDSDRHLSLTRCPNFPKCKEAPISRGAHIKNKLTLAIRRHVKSFYAGYISCEDPACGERTRNLPLNLRGAFPVCTGCSKAIMTKEYAEKQLYRQLLYYQHLFDWERAKNRYGSGKLSNPFEDFYESIFEHVKCVMKDNKYSVIDLSKVFTGFVPPRVQMTTADSLI